MIRNALAYASDIPRALASFTLDSVIDRALGRLGQRLPQRTISSCDGDPYLTRHYVAGRVGQSLPEGTRERLGWLPWGMSFAWLDRHGELREVRLPKTVYLHLFHRPDREPEHHSHPWRWAWSMVLAGGYIEETVVDDAAGPDATVCMRVRGRGSVGVLTEATFHRVAALLERRCWTLFVVGERVDTWHFRRADGTLVEWEAFIEAREKERAKVAVALSRASMEATAEEWARQGWLGVEPGEKATDALLRGHPPAKVVGPNGVETELPRTALIYSEPARPLDGYDFDVGGGFIGVYCRDGSAPDWIANVTADGRAVVIYEDADGEVALTEADEREHAAALAHARRLAREHFEDDAAKEQRRRDAASVLVAIRNGTREGSIGPFKWSTSAVIIHVTVDGEEDGVLIGNWPGLCRLLGFENGEFPPGVVAFEHEQEAARSHG